VAALAVLPNQSQELLLVLFTQSITQLIDRAYQTTKDRRVNKFDRTRINSFLQRPGISDRPSQIHLKPSTYQCYRQVWQRLVCFAYRTSRPDQTMILRHQLTTAQLAALDQMEATTKQLLQEESKSQALEQALDRACLDFSIALLDHSLKGDLFESTVIGFLAALGVDTAKQTFHELYGYTGHLSGLVKMAQMLVVELAVQMADGGAVAHTADALDSMRERFLLHGVRAPFRWIMRLRTYGKKILNATASQGYIYWSEDEQTLTYKELRLKMTGFRRFIRAEMELAQADLAELFLIHEDASREDVVPNLSLAELQDDSTNNTREWNFLQYQPNRSVLATGGTRWLMNRVLGREWLREEFVDVERSETQVVWRSTAVHRYLQQINRFLERLLLLVHITAGQPGRATDLLSLRYVNTVHGRHRNIFIENGLVSAVTAYHKGYSVSNSTKIIHRYLPKPASELVVYYLWLVLPFAQNLERRMYDRQGKMSPFLWFRGEGSWDPEWLRVVLQREAKSQLQTKMNILSYRHAAIAISRVHLKCGGFKRDYGTDDALFNEQASHGSWTAGTVYARGLQEAPGHVEARRRRYRAISREWHGFLGFEAYLGPRKRAAEEEETRCPKRPYALITMDLDTLTEYSGL
jgi:hypothetical protein